MKSLIGDGLFEVVMTTGALSTSQISRARSGGRGEEGVDSVHAVLLLAEVEDLTVGLGRVEDAVWVRRRLGSAVVLEFL